MSNFLEPGGDDENLRRNTDWGTNIEGQFCGLRIDFQVT